MKKNNEKKLICSLIIILVLIDQIIKLIILKTGARFDLGNGWKIEIEPTSVYENNLLYIFICIIVIIAIYRYLKSSNSFIKLKNRIILSFAMAGVIGIFIDRLWAKHVINYIFVPHFTYLNLSYIYILITWIGIAWMLTLYTNKNIKQRKLKK